MKVTHELLERYVPFNTLSVECLNKVIEKASIKQFEKGAIIFKRGRELKEAFYLVKGNVDLIDAQFSINSLSSEQELYRFMLDESSPTQVSALAKTQVTVLTLDRDFLDLLMAWSESGQDSDAEETHTESEENDWMLNLLRSPLFQKIPPGNISQLFMRFHAFPVNAEDIIVREGEKGDYFYVIKSGTATVLDEQGQVLAGLRAGDFFGEEALVGDTTRNATIKMLTPGVLMRLDKPDFILLLQEPVRRYISFEELREIMKYDGRYQILDVRIPFERRFQHIPNSRNIPLNQLRRRLSELNNTIIYVVADDAGRRADVATQLLSQAGFETMILQQASLQHVSS